MKENVLERALIWRVRTSVLVLSAHVAGCAIFGKSAQTPGVSDITCENVRIQSNDHSDFILI